MNSHQRRKALRAYERRRCMRGVPYALIEQAIDTPGGLSWAEEVLKAAGIQADLRTFKVDLDGTAEHVPMPTTTSKINEPWPDECRRIALDYLVWRRNRAQQETA